MLLLPIYQANIQTDPGLPSNAGIRSLRYGFSAILLSVTDQLNIVIQLKMTWKDINDWHVLSGKHWDNQNGAKIESEYDKHAFDEFLEVCLYPYHFSLKY